MLTVTAMMNKLQKVNIKDVAVDAVIDTREQLIAEQVQQQMEGKNSEGENIGYYKNLGYAYKKHFMNPKPGFGVVDLQLKGDYHRTMFVDVREDEFIIGSADEKAAGLEKKYNKNGEIYGLSPERKSKYATGVYADRIRQIITNKTGLSF